MVRDRTFELEGPSQAWRERAVEAPREQHRALIERARCLHQIEVGPRLAGVEPPERLRVVAWNTERLKHVEASADLLRSLEADVVLLSEVDLGMARSGNRRNAAELAALLGMTWVYGVEYVELGLGGGDEQREHAGAVNRHGLHGNAVLARLPLLEPQMLRLEADGAWFTGERKKQPRVGGRIGVAARVETSEGPIGVLATHLESQSDPKHRAGQMRVLLDGLEQIDPDIPWLIGGDLNTNTVHDKKRGWQQRAVAERSDRLIDPVAYEPLFEVAKRAGYAWRDANTLRVPTQRLHPGEAERPLARLDWFLARDLVCSEPATIAALDPDGLVLADHEPIAVTVRCAPG